MRQSTTEEEPTNAVLEAKLDDLSRRLTSFEVAQEAFRNRMEGKFDSFSSTIATLERRVEVDETKAAGTEKSLGEKIEDHEAWHERQQKAADEKKEQSQATSQLTVGLLSVGATILGVVVALLVH